MTEALLKDINQLYVDLQNPSEQKGNDLISRTAFYILATSIPEVTSAQIFAGWVFLESIEPRKS